MTAPVPLPTRPGLAVPHLVVAGAVVVLVLVQAALAGQHLFYPADRITLHGHLGNATFAATALGVVLTVARRLPGTAFALAVALFALTFAQVGLGYVGRTEPAAAAWHIPLGVAIVALASVQLAVLAQLRGGPPGR